MRTLDRVTNEFICGVDMDKVHPAYLAAAIKKIGQTFDPTAPLGAMVELFNDKMTADCYAACSNCHGMFDDAEENCSYCGANTPNSAIVVAATAELVTGSLDELVTEVHRLKGNVATGYWHLGKHLQKVHASFKTDENGLAKHKSFARFCLSELGLTDVSVYKMIDVAMEFDEAAVCALGPTKLDFIMRLPPKARPDMIEKAKADKLSAKEIKKQVEASLVANPPTEAVSSGRKDPSKSVGKPRAREMITLVEMEGDREFPLFTHESAGASTRVPATDADNAIGFHYLVNDVALTFTVSRNEKGELVGKCSFRRPK